jgi:hypothetical protein
MVRGAQRGIIKSALQVVSLLGIARLALGFAGGPVMWGITAAAWIFSGGYDLVASALGVPTVEGTIRGIKDGLGIEPGGPGGNPCTRTGQVLPDGTVCVVE